MLTVIVPLEFTVSVQVAVMVPLNRTFPVAADAVWSIQATRPAAPMAARKNFIETSYQAGQPDLTQRYSRFIVVNLG
ncbi:hypothetical protein [Mesorhizobium sp. LjNodule214]|uniref:hypothetical protein n=1 Tax=Mesorhizobium sp. LjNodule214 TaxID=3342252 RepID=UPI003ECD55CE